MDSFRARGTLTALVTPFTAEGKAVDFPAFERLVEEQIAGGISGLVPCGTTGETPTLSDAEQHELIRRCVAVAKGRVPVMAGTGLNSTSKTIESSQAALAAGADAVMIVMPYYNKPSQDGLRRHVELVAAAVDAPIVLYNIPGRSGVELSVESALRLLETCPRVIGVKDATGNVLWCQDFIRRAGDRCSILSGDDPLTLPMMSVGAQGVISVTSNVYPKQVSDVVRDALAGRWADARKKHLALLPVHKTLFVEPNPQPTKAALAHRGTIGGALRPPMIEASEATQRLVVEAMAAFEGV